MLLYLALVFWFFYNTNSHRIIMDFTLNTIMGDRDCPDYAALVMRSCLFVTRANSRTLSLGGSFNESRGTNMGSEEDDSETDQQHEQLYWDDEVRVVSFEKRASKKRGNKVLGSGLISFSKHRDSIVVYSENHEKSKNSKTCLDDDDDETASTVDMEEDEFPVPRSALRKKGSQSGRKRTVHFERGLVTAVHTRPRTTKEDKYYLHYDEYDYMDFKLEYRDDLLQEQKQKQELSGETTDYGNQPRRITNYRRSPRKVSFKREVVASVHPVMDRSQRNKILSDLFYTEEEMRQFLDEFVASLQKQSMQQQQKEISS